MGLGEYVGDEVQSKSVGVLGLGCMFVWGPECSHKTAESVFLLVPPLL